jgi:hypothetical protein
VIKDYQKFVYWLTISEFNLLKEGLADQNSDLFRAKKAVCLPLSRDLKIAFVEPRVWDEYPLCHRQFSWYRESPFRQKILVVSAFPLEDYGLQPETIIRDSKFRSRIFPDRVEQLRLIQRESYQKSRPEAWENISQEDPDRQKRWLRVMGLGHMDYQELFVGHCANHANFIEPEYYISEGPERVPYSIGRTPYICSACLEFYNIIGADKKKKYVVPCPGAVLFAGMAANHFYEVWHP